MKSSIIITFVSFFGTFTFGQNQLTEKDSCDTFLAFLKSKVKLLKYIDNACPNDSSCLTEIVEAKSEIARGSITFCMPEGLGIFEIRQEQQLKQLCTQNGFNFKCELFSDVGNIGQTHGSKSLSDKKRIIKN